MRHFRLIIIIFVIFYSFGYVLNSQTRQFEIYMNDCVDQKTGKPCEERPGYLQLYPEKGNINLTEFKRYQTFDEFKMKGTGKPVHEPFVYVKTEKDKITVIVSDDTTNVMTYHLRDGLWYNHMDFDLWKKDLPISKDSKENWARSYDRICGNDTIVELKRSLMGISTSVSIFLKTPSKCTKSHFLHPSHYDRIDDPFKHLRHLTEIFVKGDDSLKNILNKKLGCDKYSLKETEDAYWYIGEKHNLCFKKNSLGFFGIQPGFDKFDRELSSQDYFP